MSGTEKMPESRRTRRSQVIPNPRRLTDRVYRHRPVILGALAAVAFVSSVAVPRAQTLTQALAETYNTNPQLLAQRALLRATDEQVPQALSFWRPQVSFTGQVTGNRSSFNPGPTTIAGITLPSATQFSTFQSNS